VIVDHQAHWLPPVSLDALTGRSRLPRAERTREGWLLEIAKGARLPAGPAITDLEAQLELATTLDIDVLVISPPPLGECQHLAGEEAAELLQGVNAEIAAAQRAHPDRVVGLAMLPMQDPAEAVAVLEEAIGLGLRGVCMLSSIQGRPIASDETLPVFRRLDELRIPLFLHPAVRSQTRDPGAPPSVAEGGIAWMAHTALAAFNLIESGTLGACPNLVVLHPHLGGVLPYVLGRIERIQDERSPLGIGEYLRTRFYTDTVSRTPGAIKLAIETYGADRVLFGSDHPFEHMAWMKQFVMDEGVADRVFSNVLPGLI
jgi:predicted TIM-barrel fold metal-dependent hydrolase